jgi:hypothetical protein
MATLINHISKKGFIEISSNISASAKQQLEALVEKGSLIKTPATSITNEIYYLPTAIDKVANYMYEAMQEVAKILIAK